MAELWSGPCAVGGGLPSKVQHDRCKMGRAESAMKEAMYMDGALVESSSRSLHPQQDHGGWRGLE